MFGACISAKMVFADAKVLTKMVEDELLSFLVLGSVGNGQFTRKDIKLGLDSESHGLPCDGI